MREAPGAAGGGQGEVPGAFFAEAWEGAPAGEEPITLTFTPPEGENARVGLRVATFAIGSPPPTRYRIYLPRGGAVKAARFTLY